MTDRNTPVEETPVPTPKGETHGANSGNLGFQWLSLRARSLTLSEGNLFLLLAIVIGLFSGLAVVLFRMTIEWVRVGLLGSALAPSRLRVLLVPAGAGLVVAFLVQKFFRASSGSGVNQTKAAVYVFDGYVPFRTVIGKFLTCSLAIGSGQSLGPEDPSLQWARGLPPRSAGV